MPTCSLNLHEPSLHKPKICCIAAGCQSMQAFLTCQRSFPHRLRRLSTTFRHGPHEQRSGVRHTGRRMREQGEQRAAERRGLLQGLCGGRSAGSWIHGAALSRSGKPGRPQANTVPTGASWQSANVGHCVAMHQAQQSSQRPRHATPLPAAERPELPGLWCGCRARTQRLPWPLPQPC